MDGGGFDKLARRLAGATTRRGVLQGALVGLVGGVAVHDATDAAPRRRSVCREAGVSCTRSGQCCSGTCERVALSVGRAPRYTCACESGKTFCSRGCRDLQSDVDHCGACGNSCGANGVCLSGVCDTLTPKSCRDFVATGQNIWCSTTVGDHEVIGCSSYYFSDLQPSTVGSVPCTSNQQCVDLGQTYGLDCSNPGNIECFCQLGSYDGPNWIPDAATECVVTSKMSNSQCVDIPGHP